MKRFLDFPDQKGVSLRRPIYSLKLLLTESATPGKLAAAAGLGILLGTLPLVACHTIAIIAVSTFLRLNKVAAVAASQLCMPPLVPALCVETGYYLMNGRFLTEISYQTLGAEALDRLIEYLVGSLALAPVLAILMAGLVYLLATALVKTRNPG